MIFRANHPCILRVGMCERPAWRSGSIRSKAGGKLAEVMVGVTLDGLTLARGPRMSAIAAARRGATTATCIIPHCFNWLTLAGERAGVRARACRCSGPTAHDGGQHQTHVANASPPWPRHVPRLTARSYIIQGLLHDARYNQPIDLETLRRTKFIACFILWTTNKSDSEARDWKYCNWRATINEMNSANGIVCAPNDDLLSRHVRCLDKIVEALFVGRRRCKRRFFLFFFG